MKGGKQFLHDFLTLAMSALIFQIPSTILMKILNRTRIYGKQNILNTAPPFVFISNHLTILDDAFVDSLVFFPRAFWNLKYLPYHTPEERNFYRGKILSTIMKYARCIPIRRDKGVFQSGIQKCIETLRAGNIVHIYPEGTRSRSGELGQAKIGIGRIIFESKVSVIPCYHRGLENILPIGNTIPKFGKRVGIQIGHPVKFDKYFQMHKSPTVWKLIADECVELIRQQKSELELKGY
jgi:monolysocardiolipin acyltransferase